MVPGTRGGEGGGKTEWRPTYLKVHGWVQSWSDAQRRGEEMLTQDEGRKLVEYIERRMSAHDKSQIDWESTERSNRGFMLLGRVLLRVKESVSTQDVWGMRRVVAKIAEDEIAESERRRETAVEGEVEEVRGDTHMAEGGGEGGGGSSSDAPRKGIFPKRTRVSPEVAPWKAPYLEVGARMLRVMESAGISSACIKPEWGPPCTRIMAVWGTRH